MTAKKRLSMRIKSITLISMGVALLSVSSWVTVPFSVNFTLQVLALLLICTIYNFLQGLLTVILYMLLGIIGLPIFSGFASGLGVMVGPTGGYILGFIFVPIIMQIFKIRSTQKVFFRALIMLLSLILVYLCGTVWYCLVYCHGDIGIFSAISVCVFPFIIPDVLKITVAAFASKRLSSLKLPI